MWPKPHKGSRTGLHPSENNVWKIHYLFWWRQSLFGFWYYVALGKCNAWRESRPVSPKQGLENSQKCWEGGLIVPTLQMKELKHKVVLVVLPVSWTRPGSLLVCLPPLDMLFHLHCSYASQRHPTWRAPVLYQAKEDENKSWKTKQMRRSTSWVRRRILCFLIRLWWPEHQGSTLTWILKHGR